jgi:hypothetical protein
MTHVRTHLSNYLDKNPDKVGLRSKCDHQSVYEQTWPGNGHSTILKAHPEIAKVN